MKEYFTVSEMQCPCCKVSSMTNAFMEMLNAAREYADIPFRITSGYRCPDHNQKIGSTSTNHVNGRAADIACLSGEGRLIVVHALLQAGFRRLGIGKRFIHCDTNGVINSIWLY